MCVFFPSLAKQVMDLKKHASGSSIFSLLFSSAQKRSLASSQGANKKGEIKVILAAGQFD